MVNKPCARAEKGCQGIVTAPGPKTLAKRIHCSRSCAIRARLDAGWRPADALTLEQRQRGGTNGGTVAGVRRRRQAALNTAAMLEGLLFTPEFLEGLSRDQIARMKAIVVRAYRRGYQLGYHAAHIAQPQRRQQAYARSAKKAREAA